MSRILATLVYSKTVGSMARKAVLAYMADRANDDGTGVWAAKQRIADEVECSKQTVIKTVGSLIADGLLVEVGHRKMSNGYTVDYSIIVDAVAALQDAKQDPQEVQNLTGQELDGSTGFTPRGQPALPKPSLNRPRPKKTSSSRVARATSVPDKFVPQMSGKTLTAVESWPPGRLSDELEGFADHHRAKGTVSKDWQASWRTWVKFSKKWDQRDGRQRREPAPDPILSAYRDACAEERAERGEEADFGTWPALPSSLSGSA